MKNKKIFVALLLACIMLFAQGCGSYTFSELSDDVECVVNSLLHNPCGLNNLYGSKEIAPVVYERIPREVVEGDEVKIRVATQPIDERQEVWIEWQVNGKTVKVTDAKIIMNSKIDGVPSAIWEGNIGKFVKGDEVTYRIYAGVDHKGAKATENFTFNTMNWEKVTQVSDSSFSQNSLLLTLSTDGQLTPQIMLTLTGQTVQMQVDCADGLVKQNADSSTVITKTSYGYQMQNEFLSAKVTEQPFSLTVFDRENKQLFATSDSALSILTDGREYAAQLKYGIKSVQEEVCQGFGMKYNSLNQRGKAVDIYCVNWYTNQDEESYSPVPYYFVPDKYGFYLDSTYYSRFDMAKTQNNVNDVYATLGGDSDKTSTAYLFFGRNEQISDGFSDVVGKAQMLPVWAFGPWISANEWNCQREIESQIRQTIANDIPTSVIVIEAWSDEDNFYIFNDATYKTVGGDEQLQLDDFTFGGRWSDPKAMIDYAHENNIKIILWQIPVMRYSTQPTPQHVIDMKYAEQKGYLLKNFDGSVYRMPKSSWFGFSQLIDFTNPEACEWFLSKRNYLITEIGIDGFKTDGGEFVWGKDVVAFDGRRGDELRNAYPDLYAQAYFDYARRYYPDAITFSRAGGAKLGSHPACWIGDQTSTFESLHSAVIALQSASISNAPFVTWDTAGFSGALPTAELYKRSVAQSVFSPLMQAHSEQPGDPNPSMARTPWNMAEVKNDQSFLDVYRYYANLRMNLLPYIYAQSKTLTAQGAPLVQSMAYAFGEQSSLYKFETQYMFGENLLVAPVTTPNGRNYKALLPQGDWYDLFTGEQFVGGTAIDEVPKVDKINVFVKAGSIIPTDTDSTLELGSFVGNDTTAKTVSGLRIYPQGASHLTFADYVSNCDVTVTVDDSLGKTSIRIDNSTITAISLRVDNVSSVVVNGQKLTLADSTSQCTYDSNSHMLEIVCNEVISSVEVTHD